MYISRPSDPKTVLLWDDRWWIPGHGATCEFTNLAHAARILIAHFKEEPKPIRLRIIYEREPFISAPVTCPISDRTTIAQALLAEYPALDQPEYAWGYEPVLPADGSGSTILHYEKEPGLFALVSELAEVGIVTASAWPLATFLHAVPEEWSETGAVTVVALRPEGATAYRHPANGTRLVRRWRSRDAIAEVGHWIGELMEKDPAEPTLVLCADHTTEARFEALFPGQTGPSRLQLGNVLGRGVVFPRHHPAQLLPRAPIFTAEKAMIAASIVFLLLAGGLAVNLARQITASRADRARQEIRVENLHRQIVHLRQNAREIALLREANGQQQAASPIFPLLEAIGKTVPPTIALDAVRLSDSEIAIEGWAATDTAAVSWQKVLTGSGAPWTLRSNSKAAAHFEWKGDFKG